MTTAVYENGKITYRDMTPEEVEAYQRFLDEEEQRRRQEPPTFEERTEAQLVYTAMMTDTLLPEEVS